MQPEKVLSLRCFPILPDRTEPDAGIVVNLSIELINVPFMTLIPRNTNSYRVGIHPFAVRPLRALTLEAELS
jgi:hypothetical protein